MGLIASANARSGDVRTNSDPRSVYFKLALGAVSAAPEYRIIQSINEFTRLAITTTGAFPQWDH